MSLVKFICSEKTTKFCEISTLLLTGTTQDKSKVEILKNFVAFSEYMNFKTLGEFHFNLVVLLDYVSNFLYWCSSHNYQSV